MTNDTIYRDSLLELRSDTIILKNYYFPLLNSKTVTIENIQTVVIQTPSLLSGKYRYFGSGDLRTWFPLDMERHKRDRIFFLILKNSRVRIGFTAENSEATVKYFGEMGLLSSQ